MFTARTASRGFPTARADEIHAIIIAFAANGRILNPRRMIIIPTDNNSGINIIQRDYSQHYASTSSAPPGKVNRTDEIYNSRIFSSLVIRNINDGTLAFLAELIAPTKFTILVYFLHF